MFHVMKVFAVRSGGATGVVVKGPDDKSSVAFRYIHYISFSIFSFAWCKVQLCTIIISNFV